MLQDCLSHSFHFITHNCPFISDGDKLSNPWTGRILQGILRRGEGDSFLCSEWPLYHDRKHDHTTSSAIGTKSISRTDELQKQFYMRNTLGANRTAKSSEHIQTVVSQAVALCIPAGGY
jgi:hypothetical protein